MCVLPSQSHDYKLVIVFPALFFILFYIQENEVLLKSTFSRFTLFIYLFIAVWLTRNHEAGFKGWNANKYLSLIIFQIITTILIFRADKNKMVRDSLIKNFKNEIL
jgi:hypothetical protein